LIPPKEKAKQSTGADDDQRGSFRVIDEYRSGQKRGNSDNRTDRKIDLAHQNHDALPNGKQCDDRNIKQHILNALTA
jgi:hypothetical protein